MAEPTNSNAELMKTFVDKLVAAKKFPDVEPEVIVEIKKDLLKRVEQHINAALLAALPQERLQEFDELLASDNDEQIQNFLKRYIPDLEATLAETLMDFKRAYLGA